MTRKDLEQIYYLNRELRLYEQELARIRARSLVSSPVGGGAKGGAPSDRVAQRAERTILLEQRISERKDEIQRLRDEAVQFISDIPDSLTRLVVYKRCVALMSWRRVAYEVGGDNTEENVRQIYSRFMRSL